MFVDSLIEICSWHRIGWQGVKCHHCGATHNILTNIPCIKCERCEAWVILSWSHYQLCHRKPDFGFNRSVTSWAMKNFSPHRHFIKETFQMLAKLNKRIAQTA